MKNRFYNDMVKAGYFDLASDKYIWIRDMEWINENKSDDYVDYVPKGVVPFAITGGGDVWTADNDSEEIYLYYHDDDEPEYYADSFENAVFRQLVEYLADSDFTESDDEEDEESTAFAKKYIKNCCEIFKPYFLKEQTDILLELAGRKIIEHKGRNYVYHSFLNFDKEAQEIISRFITDCGEENKNESDLHIKCNANVEYMTDSRLLEIKDYCLKMSKKYVGCAGSFDETKKVCHELFYKNSCNDINFYRLESILESGKFDVGIMKKSADDCKDNYVKYYLDDENYPIYAEHYLNGSQNPPFSRRVYFRENRKMIFSEYRLEENGEFVYISTEENTYDENGKITSFLRYNEHTLNIIEEYHYSDGKLSESVRAESYSFGCDIGDDTYRAFPLDDDFDELFDGGMNPQIYAYTKYIYENDMIVSMKRSERNDDGVFEEQCDIDKKAVNSLVKKGMI